MAVFFLTTSITWILCAPFLTLTSQYGIALWPSKGWDIPIQAF